jgi:TRAP transporter TAXI family solute receptor
MLVSSNSVLAINKYKLGTASVSGSSFLFGSAFAVVVNNNSDKVELVAVATGGTADNIEQIRKGELAIGLTSSDWLYNAYNGINMPEFKDIRILWAMYAEKFHMITKKDDPGKTIYDFKGRRVSFGNRGSGTYASSAIILESLGLSFEDFKASYLPTGESLTALANGQIDAMITITGSPHPGTMELAVSLPGGIKLIPLSDEDIKKVQEKYPYMTKTIIPAGTYEGVDYDAPGVGGYRYLATSTAFPADDAYEIAKVIDENYEELVAAYAGAADATAETTASATIVPLHEGVKKYLKEKGLLD